jgi:hypothetical protein
MFYRAPGFRLSAFELRLSAADDLRSCGRQGIIGINHALPFLNRHAVLLLRDRHQIPFLDLKGVEDLARDDHLPSLSDTGDPLWSCGCFPGHAFILRRLLVSYFGFSAICMLAFALRLQNPDNTVH